MPAECGHYLQINLGNFSAYVSVLPISVLPFVVRVFEKLIYNQLYDYLDGNKLLFSKQSG